MHLDAGEELMIGGPNVSIFVCFKHEVYVEMLIFIREKHSV